MFFLSGFGYFADSLILLLMSITVGPAVKEFRPSFPRGVLMAAYAGMLTGALFFGFTGDMIARRLAFNSSLFICSTFAIVAGASPNWITLGPFVSLSCFGGGGNVVLDATVFLEFLPSKYQWLLTVMACWWGLGPVVAAAFAWPFLSLPQFICATGEVCTRSKNMGWRYVWFANGALVMVLSILRIMLVHLPETPKFLISQGRDEEAVAALQKVANRYNRPCSLTVDQLLACGQIKSHDGSESPRGFTALAMHLKGLFQTRQLALSTSLIWLSWLYCMYIVLRLPPKISRVPRRTYR